MAAFLKDGRISSEYIELESRKKNSRPQLIAAIKHARKSKATLRIAELDQLSRNAAFIFMLKDSVVDFVCVDMPDANTLAIGIFAVLAEYKRVLISSRTKSALQAKKIQGFTLSKPENLTERARHRGLQIRQENACSHKDNRQATGLIVMYRGKGMNYQIIAQRLKSHDFTTR